MTEAEILFGKWSSWVELKKQEKHYSVIATKNTFTVFTPDLLYKRLKEL